MTAAAPRPLILGTAGHIDHGKTSLIGALTGVETDRLPEEKARGITIELGFAPLELPSGQRLGIVDVPGHEGLVRTMVAGASGIDLVLLVVAADEGVMPQTREHLEICNLLGLRNAVVALTKTDLADPEVAELAEAEVAELLESSALGDAPIVPVSAVTGAGLPELTEALEKAARAANATPRRQGPARLWVDRAFEIRGFGAVATGTLAGAPFEAGKDAVLYPAEKTARIRGLQSFGEPVETAQPGSRCAVNLQGVGLSELGRGMLIAEPDQLTRCESFDAEVAWLAAAPELGTDPSAVELLIGTTQFRARIAPIGTGRIVPGESCYARVHLDDGSGAFLPGDAFVVRGFARLENGGQTLGGGRVLDVAPPRRRRSDPALVEGLAILARGDLESGILHRIERAGFEGTALRALQCEAGLRPAALATMLEGLERSGRIGLAGDRAVGEAILAALEKRLVRSLDDFHDAEPMRPGMPRGALRGALPGNVPRAIVDLALTRLEAAGAVEAEDDLVRAHDFVPRLTQRHEAIAARIRADAMIADLEPPSAKDQEAELGLSTEEHRALLAHLERDGSLVRAPGDLWFDAGAVDDLRERVIAYLREHGELTTVAYKELIGTTRKFAVPLMELFDSEHLTQRRGEVRVLRRQSGPRRD